MPLYGPSSSADLPLGWDRQSSPRPARPLFHDGFTTGWADLYARGTVGFDTVDYVESASSLKIITSNDGLACGASKTIVGCAFGRANFRIWVKADTWANVGGLQLMLAGDSTPTNYYYINFPDYFQNFNDGEWHELVLSRQHFSSSGSPNWDAITYAIVRAWSANGATPTVRFDGFTAFEQSSRGFVSLVFDDGWSSQYDTAAPYLEKYGFAAGCFIIPGKVAATGYMTQTQIDALASRGWDVGGHGDVALTSLSATAAEADVKTTKAYLGLRGYKGQDLYAWPEGQNTDALRSMVGKYFSSAFTINYTNQPLTYVSPMRVNRFSVITGTTTATIQGYIDRAMAEGTWLVLTFHKIATSPTVSTEYSTANFQTVIDYLASSGAAVMPASAVLARTHREVLPDTALEARTHSLLFEDFHNLLVGTIFTATQAGTSAASAINLPPAGRIGAVQSTTGTTTTGYAQVATPGNLYDITANPSRLVIAAQLGALSTVAEEFIARVGFSDGAAGAAPTDGVWFEYDRLTAGDFWRICTSAGGVTTKTTTSSVPDASYHRFEIVVNSTTSAVFKIDDVTVGTITTNLPSGSGQTTGVLWGITKSAGTTTRSLRADYVLFDTLTNR